MSIISDAIKKARKESGRKSQDVAADMLSGSGTREVSGAAPVPSSPIPSSEAKWMFVVIASLAVIASLFGSVFLYRYLTRQVDSKKVSSAVVMPKPAKVSARTLLDRNTTNTANPIILNGIVYGPDDKWAIINDRIVREGDAVLGGKLVLIKKDSVRIEKPGGNDIVLDLR